MFNKDNMDAANPKKLSHTRSVGLRLGDQRAKIDALVTELRRTGQEVTISDVVREGLEAFWPQIRAYHLVRRHQPVSPEQLSQVVQVITAALQHGLTPQQIEAALHALLEQKLSA